jgi:DNA invertase Pin-like site-specific DNA recombinase
VKVIGYVRCSTDEQRDWGLGLAAQRAAIQLEARRHGWKLVEIFEDVASGRSLRQRPGLEAAFAAVANGAADGLIHNREVKSRSNDASGLTSGWTSRLSPRRQLPAPP